MAITLYHHPYSRAATVVWMLEELGQPYALEYVDLRAGAQKEEPHLHRNRMGKLPVLVDDGTPISETAAIGLYLADRYALGTLAPALDDPTSGSTFRAVPRTGHDSANPCLGMAASYNAVFTQKWYRFRDRLDRWVA